MRRLSGKKSSPCTAAGHVPARLCHGLVHLVGDGVAEEALVNFRGQRAAAPYGNAHAKHRANQLSQPGKESLLPAFDRGEGKHDKEENIIENSGRK